LNILSVGLFIIRFGYLAYADVFAECFFSFVC